MPVFRINKDLHYFAHVPKCGGMSIEAYLLERFSPLGMYKADRYNVPAHQRWTPTSLVHVPGARLVSIYPVEWFASSFALVRQPVRRLVSAFFFARDMVRSIPPETAFNARFQETAPRLEKAFCLCGGHLVPQTDQVPERAHILRFEDGLKAVVADLDALGGKREGPRELPAKNIKRWRGQEEPPEIAQATLALIARLYAADFQRFGYPLPANVAKATTLPDLPVLAATGRPPAPRRSFLRRLQGRLENRARGK